MTNKYRIDYAEDGSTEITVPAGKAGTSANDNQAGQMPFMGCRRQDTAAIRTATVNPSASLPSSIRA
ncbi:MAG: hypothetical protein HC788_09795 [Sphingopyxis sp.]|nr:hypothetical protein [Sphingopyxis sp.]